MGESTQQISIVKKDDYLLVNLPPSESLRERESQISAMHDAVDKHNCRRLLIDARSTRKQMPIMDLFELCLYMVDKFEPVQVKMAILASPEAVYPDRFGENVIRNRGLDALRFVDNEQTALEWLLAPTTAPQP